MTQELHQSVCSRSAPYKYTGCNIVKAHGSFYLTYDCTLINV